MARVLVVSDLWFPFPGGAERLMFNLARSLQQRGHLVGAVTGYGPALHGDGCPVEPHAIGVREDHAQGAAVLADVVKNFRPDVLLVHHFYAYEFEHELVGFGIPVVQVVLNTRRLAGADLAVFISRYVMDQLEALPGDLLITPPAYPDVVADSHGDAIGFVKPIAHKGVELVYRIARAMPARQFVILRGEWQNIEVIERLPNVTFMEPVIDMREFYARCRLLLVPSTSEDAGTVAQEATVNGLPVIASDVGGLRETAAGGILVPAQDLDAWLLAIRLLDAPAAYRQVVDAQLGAYLAHDHEGTLDRLSAAIDGLVP